ALDRETQRRVDDRALEPAREAVQAPAGGMRVVAGPGLGAAHGPDEHPAVLDDEERRVAERLQAFVDAGGEHLLHGPLLVAGARPQPPKDVRVEEDDDLLLPGAAGGPAESGRCAQLSELLA